MRITKTHTRANKQLSLSGNKCKYLSLGFFRLFYFFSTFIFGHGSTLALLTILLSTHSTLFSVFGNDGFGDMAWYIRVVVEFHTGTGTALGHAAQIGGIAEHLA